MSKKADQIARLERACQELYDERGEDFRVTDLASQAGVSNTSAGPYRKFWFYRRAQEALVSGLTARAEAQPKSDIAAVCEVANQANANVLALIETVNNLIAATGDGKGELRSKEPRATTAGTRGQRSGVDPEVESLSGRRRSTEISAREVEPAEDFAEPVRAAKGKLDKVGGNPEPEYASLRRAESDPKKEEDVSEATVLLDKPSISENSAIAAPTATNVENNNVANSGGIELRRAIGRPAEDLKGIKVYDNSLDNNIMSFEEKLPLISSKAVPLSLFDSGFDPSIAGSLHRHAEADVSCTPTQFKFDFCATDPSASEDPTRYDRSAIEISAPGVAPLGQVDDHGGGEFVKSWTFAEGVAEAVLLTAGCALSANKIYGQLPPGIRSEYSRQYFSDRLRESDRLHYEDAGEEFYVKITSETGSPSARVPIHLALTSAVASILEPANEALTSEIIHSRLNCDLQSKVSSNALQSMLLAGAAENPIIEVNRFGDWHLAGRVMPIEHEPGRRDLLLRFEMEVKDVLKEDNHPMRGVDIHEKLSDELQGEFKREKIYRDLKKVRGIFQTDDDKWWLNTKRVPKPNAPVLDPTKSARAAEMAIWKLITEEAERLVAAQRPGEMSIDQILGEVRKRFKVSDEVKFARALNSRRKAAKAKIVRVSEGVYRARRANEL